MQKKCDQCYANATHITYIIETDDLDFVRANPMRGAASGQVLETWDVKLRCGTHKEHISRGQFNSNRGYTVQSRPLSPGDFDHTGRLSMPSLFFPNGSPRI